MNNKLAKTLIEVSSMSNRLVPSVLRAWAWWTQHRINLLQPDLRLEVIVTQDAAGQVRVFYTKPAPAQDTQTAVAVCNALMTGASAIAAQHGMTLRMAPGPIDGADATAK